ncbi:hypothetical protein BHM03_00051876 [Ensete ventricosum]|nr:hypothetical protein BHM03_00051876 [Ensete ventricosum]
MVGGTLKNTRNINLVVMKKLASRSCLLPDDVLMEILSYLPGKTFFKLLSVCKTFRQLSSNSHFLLSESYHSKAISGFFAQRYSTVKSLVLIDPYAGLPRSNYLRGGIAVRFMTDDNRLTKDYKLVYLSPTNKSSLHRCQVYDSTARAWTMNKKLNSGWRALDLKHPVVSGETIFWVSKLGTHMLIDPYVFAFNMRTEWTQIIALPDEATIRDFDIIGIAEWGLGKPCYVSSVVLSEVETSMLLVFVVHDEVCSYNIQDGDLRKLGSVGIYDPTLIPYVNSLRPCGEQEELLEAI